MSGIAFLVAAVALSVAGCAILLLRHRKPTSLEHGVDAFRRQMLALAPERRRQEPPGPGGAPGHVPPVGGQRAGR